ncbi:MAG: class II fructose-bisphosphatase [Anaerolineae bacterium]|nr:class II fructose-bisphosphatase [Anaerolineae bacterium]
MSETIPANIGLDLVRVTEATALAAGRWLGLGKRGSAHLAATEAMYEALSTIDIDGYVVIGEEGRIGNHSPLDSGKKVGTGKGPRVDVVVDPIDGTRSVAKGLPSAISVIGISPRGTMWSAQEGTGVYMDKIVVNREAADKLVVECMDAPAGWTLALVARAKNKEVRDLQVAVLERPRHEALIEEIRNAGARVLLRFDGDSAGALMAATPGTGVDLLMGIGGIPEGVTAACAVRAMKGAMLGRLAPQSDAERAALAAAAIDIKKIFTDKELVTTDQIFFAATGVTTGPLLQGVYYRGSLARTQSLLIRAETGIRRLIQTEHLLSDNTLNLTTSPLPALG